eukprot:UN13827
MLIHFHHLFASNNNHSGSPLISPKVFILNSLSRHNFLHNLGTIIFSGTKVTRVQFLIAKFNRPTTKHQK